MSREQHNKMAMVENLVWEVAKILAPNSYINPQKVARAQKTLVEILTKD